jgi:hypothetical protein
MHSSTNIIKVIRLRRIKLTGHVACMGDMRNVFDALVGKPDRNYGELDVSWNDSPLGKRICVGLFT